MLVFCARAHSSLALGESGGFFALPWFGKAAQLAPLAKDERKLPNEAKQFA